MWWSEIIRVVALSSQDAEFMALSDASREVLFLQNLLASIGCVTPKTPLFGDNRGSIVVTNRPGGHQKTKHIDIRYFFIRQQVEDGRIEVKYVSTVDQLADVLTKALGRLQHTKLVRTLMGYQSE